MLLDELLRLFFDGIGKLAVDICGLNTVLIELGDVFLNGEIWNGDGEFVQVANDNSAAELPAFLQLGLRLDAAVEPPDEEVRSDSVVKTQSSVVGSEYLFSGVRLDRKSVV